MKHVSRSLVASLLVAVALVGCHRARFLTGDTTPEGQLVVYAPAPSAMAITMQTDPGTLRAAIATALVQLSYVLESEDGQRLVAHMNDRRTTLEIAIEYTPSQVSVTYVDSMQLPIEDTISSRQYDDYMRALFGAIQSELDRPAREAAEAQARAEQAQRDADEREIARQSAERIERERLATERAQAEAVAAQARLGLTLPQVQGGVSVTVAGLAFDPRQIGRDAMELAASGATATISGVAGGPLRAEQLGFANCPGWFQQAPQHTVVLQADIPYLRIEAPSAGDMTLVIVAPGGVVWCDDDSGGDLVPRIEGSFPAGPYRVYVGNYRGADPMPYQLTFSQTPVVAVAPPSGAEMIVNGGFEQPQLAPNSLQTTTQIPGWFGSFGPGMELQHGVAGTPAEGAQHIELDSEAPSGIYQDVATNVGASYDLSFAYSPRPGVAAASNRIDVFFGGLRVASVTAPGEGLPDTRWATFHVTVQASAPVSRIELRDAGSPDTVGGFLDAISLRGSSVPPAPVTGAGDAAPGELVANGGFEQPLIGVGGVQTLAAIPGWGESTGAGIEIQSGVAGRAFEGAQLVELDSSSPSAIFQDVSTHLGARYDVSLAYSPRPGIGDNRMEVWLGGRMAGSFAASGEGLADTLWYQVTLVTRPYASPTRIELRDTSAADSVGAYVDAVSMVAAAQ